MSQAIKKTREPQGSQGRPEWTALTNSSVKPQGAIIIQWQEGFLDLSLRTSCPALVASPTMMLGLGEWERKPSSFLAAALASHEDYFW